MAGRFYEYRCSECGEDITQRRTLAEFKVPAVCQCGGEAPFTPTFQSWTFWLSSKYGYDESRRIAWGGKTEKEMAHMPDERVRVDDSGNEVY